jgi:hypothetical protein
VKDTVTTQVYRAYKHETNEEIERKRKVWRGLILNGKDVDLNEARIAGLNQVVHERQQRKERRELLAELTEWGKLLTTWGKLVGAFGGGVVASFVWKFVAQMWRH